MLQQKKRFRLERFVLASVLLFVALFTAWTLERENAQVRADEGARLAGQARVVDENLIRQLQGVDHALQRVRDSLPHGNVPARGALITTALTSMSDAMPGVSTMILQDREGVVVASSRPELLGKNFAERPYFQAPRKVGDPTVLYVSGPLKTVLGTFVMFVGRVVRNEAGEFVGVVSASLDPAYFKVIIGSVLYAPDMRITLFDFTGNVFLTLPTSEHADDLHAATPDSLLARLRSRGEQALLADASDASGEKRMVALHDIDEPDLHMDRPMLIAVSRDLAMVERPWRSKVVQLSSVFAALAGALCIALFFDQRRRADLTRVAVLGAAERIRAAAALRDSEDQLRQLTDNMPALVAALDLDQRFRFANRAFQDWLHLDPGALIGLSLRGVWGEETYATFAHHIATALTGEKVVYEREMRMQNGVRRVEVTLVAQRDAEGGVKGLHALITDISARFEADLLRMRSEERLSLALEGSGQALFDWDLASDRMYQSAQAAAMRGLPAEAMTGSGVEMRGDIHPDDFEGLMAQVADVVHGRTPLFRAEFRRACVPEGWVWVRAQGRVFERDGDGKALRIAGTVADISVDKAAEGQLRRLAEIDDLTGLPNRAVFNERLERALARVTTERPMSLLFLDIDHFKVINDTHGHAAGDEVLQVCAARMRSVVRAIDTVARLAGDEFTIILEALHDPRDAGIVAGKLVERLRVPVVLSSATIVVTVSIGIAHGVPGEQDPGALLRRADAALYETKRRGRDGYFGADGVPTTMPDVTGTMHG